MNLKLHLQEESTGIRLNKSSVGNVRGGGGRGGYLIILPLAMGGVWRLIANEHVIQVKPGERGDCTSVVREVGDEAMGGGFGDVED